jgi:hypothetical protein
VSTSSIELWCGQLEQLCPCREDEATDEDFTEDCKSVTQLPLLPYYVVKLFLVTQISFAAPQTTKGCLVIPHNCLISLCKARVARKHVVLQGSWCCNQQAQWTQARGMQ